MIYIHKFVTEDDLAYYKGKTDDEIKELLSIDKYSTLSPDSHNHIEKIKQIDLRKLYGLPDGELDLLLKQFRENNFTKYCRKNPWRHGYTKVLNNDGSIKQFQTKSASFRYVNKWKQESEPQEYKIIIDENNKILWIGIDDGFYFLSVSEAICGFKYEHKTITLFPNICSNVDYFNKEQSAENDDLIVKYRKNIGAFRFSSCEDIKTVFHEEKIGVTISIEEFFPKGFFFKGKKWNKYFEYMYGRDTTILTSIQPRDDLFQIDIENITYPHYGFFLLDLKNLQVNKAEK